MYENAEQGMPGSPSGNGGGMRAAQVSVSANNVAAALREYALLGSASW